MLGGQREEEEKSWTEGSPFGSKLHQRNVGSESPHRHGDSGGRWGEIFLATGQGEHNNIIISSSRSSSRSSSSSSTRTNSFPVSHGQDRGVGPGDRLGSNSICAHRQAEVVLVFVVNLSREVLRRGLGQSALFVQNVQNPSLLRFNQFWIRMLNTRQNGSMGKRMGPSLLRFNQIWIRK